MKKWKLTLPDIRRPFKMRDRKENSCSIRLTPQIMNIGFL